MNNISEMKNLNLIILLLITIFWDSCSYTKSIEEITPSLTLWYNKPANGWIEALPVGNGRIGGMVYGGLQNDTIQFNEET